MTPDLAAFRIIYPEFSPVSDEIVEFYIADAVETLNENAWGVCYAKAVLSLAAHNLALSMARQASATDDGSGVVEIGATGAIASASAGGLSVSFTPTASASSDDGAFYSQTPYGQHYMSLRRECLSRGRLVCQ